MKKYILILIASFAALSGFSQLATVNQQTVQSVKLDTIAARLVRGAVLGGATAANQATQTTSLGVINESIKSNSVITSATISSMPSVSVTTGTLAAVSNATISSMPSVSVTTGTLAAVSNATISSMPSVTMAATEAHLGQVGGTYSVIPNTITTSTTSYSDGDNIGGIVTVSEAFRITAGSAEITDITVWDKANQKPTITIDFWNASPTSGTYTDNAAEVIVGDHGKWLGSVTISSSDYVTTGAVGRASIKNTGLIVSSAATRNLFFTITTSSTPTYSSGTTGLLVYLGIKQN
jgi:hypothetical protein